MRFLFPTLLLGLCSCAAIAAPPIPPYPKTSNSTSAHDAGNVINFLVALGYAEIALLREGARNYSGASYANASMPDSLDCDIDQMIVNSGAHLGFLTHALKEMGVPQAGACRYDFPVTTAREFVELASKIAEVTVSTYIKAGKELLQALDYSSQAVSLLSVKARHSATLRLALGKLGAPTPFEYALDFPQSFTLGARPFQTWCPFNGRPLLAGSGVDLVLQTPGELYPSKVLEFTSSYDYSAGDLTSLYLQFSSGEKEIEAPAAFLGDSVYTFAPIGLRGQTYVALMSRKETGDRVVLAGPSLVEFPEFRKGHYSCVV